MKLAIAFLLIFQCAITHTVQASPRNPAIVIDEKIEAIRAQMARGWWLEAQRQVDLLLELPGAPTRADVQLLRADVCYQALHISCAYESLGRAADIATGEEAREASELLELLDQKVGRLEISLPARAPFKSRVLPTFSGELRTLDPHMKALYTSTLEAVTRFNDPASEEADSKVLIWLEPETGRRVQARRGPVVLRLYLPRGEYRIARVEGYELRLAGGEESENSSEGGKENKKPSERGEGSVNSSEGGEENESPPEAGEKESPPAEFQIDLKPGTTVSLVLWKPSTPRKVAWGFAVGPSYPMLDASDASLNAATSLEFFFAGSFLGARLELGALSTDSKSPDPMEPVPLEAYRPYYRGSLFAPLPIGAHFQLQPSISYVSLQLPYIHYYCNAYSLDAGVDTPPVKGQCQDDATAQGATFGMRMVFLSSHQSGWSVQAEFHGGLLSITPRHSRWQEGDFWIELESKETRANFLMAGLRLGRVF